MYTAVRVFYGSVIKVIPLRISMQYARILYRHSYPPFVPVLICPLFPHTKNNPTPYFAHFLKEILRMRAHSREGNIKGYWQPLRTHFDNAKSQNSPNFVP